ncbi:MAG TPA: hypothetical protein VFW38_06790 [Solirubrobacteraceae bacterium]|nr:hypothetical protein [Solirubrobacteraceae bacterium]
MARAAAIACLLTLCAAGPVAAASLTRTVTALAPGDYSVTLEQCLSAGAQSERSATFVAQMVGTAATQKMAMKIQLEERAQGEAEYHQVAPIGPWKASEPGVKIYKYVKQVTNLAASAVYRLDVRFRWVGDKGKVIKRAELRSARCFQPALVAPSGRPTTAG